MGKNTMMKRSIRLYCEKTGNDQWPGVIDSLVGNVGLIFTKGDLNEVRCAPSAAWVAISVAPQHVYICLMYLSKVCLLFASYVTATHSAAVKVGRRRNLCIGRLALALS